jgi:hypothetical protein
MALAPAGLQQGAMHLGDGSRTGFQSQFYSYAMRLLAASAIAFHWHFVMFLTQEAQFVSLSRDAPQTAAAALPCIPQRP